MSNTQKPETPQKHRRRKDYDQIFLQALHRAGADGIPLSKLIEAHLMLAPTPAANSGVVVSRIMRRLLAQGHVTRCSSGHRSFTYFYKEKKD